MFRATTYTFLGCKEKAVEKKILCHECRAVSILNVRTTEIFIFKDNYRNNSQYVRTLILTTFKYNICRNRIYV